MELKSAESTQTDQIKVNDSYIWKLPSARHRLEDIKNAKHGEIFESVPFPIDSLQCYLELHPNGCNDRTEGEIMLFICIQSMPASMSTIVSNFKLSLKETNTVVIKRTVFRQHKLHSNWVRGTLQLDEIQHLNQLTFEVVMDVERITDIAGNNILKNPIDLNKENLMKQMIFTESRLDEAVQYLLAERKCKCHIYFDPEGWLYEAGIIYYNNGAYEKAIEACLQAKSDGDELVVIGQAYQDMDDNENAIKYYEQYMSEYPKHSTRIMNVPCSLGACYHSMADIDKAKEWFLKGTKISQEKNIAWERYANLVRYNDKNYAEALSVYLEHFDEENAKHYADVASIYHQMDDKVKSKEFWIKGVMKHPNDIALNQAYANYLLGTGYPRTSLFYNRRIIKKNEHRIDVLIKIMKALKLLNKVDECISVINKVMVLIKNVYEMKLNKEKIVDSYTYALNTNRKEKTRLLIVLQFDILDCLQSIAVGDKYKDLFRDVLNFVIKINEEFSTEYNMLHISEYLLYLKDTKQLHKIFDNWKTWNLKAIKTFGLIYYELNEHSKSIEILLRALDIKETEDDGKNELTGCYYGLCLNYLELNNDMYNKYLTLALERESLFIKAESWDKHFQFDEKNGKYPITFPDVEIKFDFDADNGDNLEAPHQSVIDRYQQLEFKTCKQEESDDERADIMDRLEEKDTDTDCVVINYCHELEWILVNQWYEMAISTSAHSMAWNELYLECLLNLKRYNEVIEYIQMFNLQCKLNNALLLEIGNYYYFKIKKMKTALKYYDAIQNGDNEKVLQQKARSHKRLNDIVKAMEYYKKVLSSDALYIGCLTEISDVLLFKTGDFENAKRFMFRGLWIDPCDHDILDTFAAYLSNATVSKYNDALIIYTKILNSGKRLSFINAARNFHKLKQNKNAIDLTVHSASLNNGDRKCATTYGNLGYYYHELYKQTKNDSIRTFYLNESRKYLKYSLMINGKNDEKSPFAHYFYANLLFFGFNKFRFAAIYYDNTLRIIDNCTPEDRQQFDTEYTQQCLLNYGKLLRVLKEYGKSNECLNKVIDFRRNHKLKSKDLFQSYDECHQLMALNLKDLEEMQCKIETDQMQ